MNRFRWYEYALSSSLIIVLIAMLFGVYDIGAIILVAVVNALMNFFGLDMEEINYYTKKLNWKPFIFGTIAGLAPWIVILLSNRRKLFCIFQSVPYQYYFIL